MFLIMGIQQKEVLKNYTKNLPCHICEGSKGFEVIETFSYFHLFFLPVWKWNFRYIIKCLSCGTYYTVKPESIKKLGGDLSAVTYWDIEPVNMKTSQSESKICSNCGYMMQADFDYCPKCGNKV